MKLKRLTIETIDDNDIADSDEIEYNGSYLGIPCFIGKNLQYALFKNDIIITNKADGMITLLDKIDLKLNNKNDHEIRKRIL